jgi:signal transduction histidine kinase
MGAGSGGAVAAAVESAAGGRTSTDFALHEAARPASQGGSLPFRPSARYLATSAVIAVGYFAFTELGKALLLKGPAGAFWPSAGLGIAILYLGGLRWWPAVLLGDLGSLASDVIQLGVAPGTALAEAAGDLGRTIASVLILHRLAGPRIAIERLREVGAVLVAVVCGAAIAATVAMIALLLGNDLSAGQTGVFWRSWWLGDVSGGLVVLSLALAWTRGPGTLLRKRIVPEAAVVIAAVIGLSTAALSAQQPLTFMVFPALIWAAVRLGPQGATLTLTIAVGIAVWVTSNELGPFVQHTANENALNLQLYITIASLTTLCVTALCSERRNAGLALADSRARIVAAADAERRRIERDLHDGAQQRLVALQVRLRLAEDLVEQDPPLARQKLADLRSAVGEVLDDVRSLAAGVYPPDLAGLGLAKALRALACRSLIPATVEVYGNARCRPEVEAVVYFCCSEALQNVAKHARGANAVRVLLECGEAVRFEVRDDGAGFSDDRWDFGRGLTNMRDRLEAVDGTLEIRSVPGTGTRVIGRISQP